MMEKMFLLWLRIFIRGVWLFYVCLVHSDAKSYIHVHRDVGAMLSSTEHTKKYSQAAEIIHASFKPFAVTADGTLAKALR